MSKRLLLCFALFAAACSAGSPPSLTLADLPSPSTDIMLVDIGLLRHDDVKGLLTLFELEKVLYELRYEINNRPAWIHVPLSGLTAMLGGAR